MPADSLRFRQIHLDFHTSELIAGIGSQFDLDEFAETLDAARVNSITCFARGHHGMIFYDTKAHPERKHPHLETNLLAEQIEACHSRDIRVPIYTTVQWDLFTANNHPEWRIITPEGKWEGTPPFEPGFYGGLCVNSPYRDFLKAHVQDIADSVAVDGLFFDIVGVRECVCKYCRNKMQQSGIDASDAGSRQKFAETTIHEFKHDMSAFVRHLSPDATIFYNAGHIGPITKPSADAYSHFELESLPSGGWGYMHFPLSVRYARNLGAPCLGMTGKFHTSWGDFHSFKNIEALQFECFQMLALGAQVSVGDQLHPEGRICEATYKLIGEVYSEVEAKEPWCEGAKPVTEIGVITPEAFTDGHHHSGLTPPAFGVCRILQEGAHQFEMIDPDHDFSGFSVLVLPDEIPVAANLKDKLKKYLADGGALIASYHSGLDPDRKNFALDEMGLTLLGDAPFSPDFIVPDANLGKTLPSTEHVMYMQGLEVEPNDGADVLTSTASPYFNRTYEHFCSHKHTPSSGAKGGPAVVRNGRAIYFAHPIFTQYHDNAPRWVKRLFLDALEMLLPEPLIAIEAPSTTLTALNEQPDKGRQILHLLHYVPERRGQQFDVIEDVIPIFDIQVSVRVSKRVSGVSCVPQHQGLPFGQDDSRVTFRVPKVDGHQMIEISFE